MDASSNTPPINVRVSRHESGNVVYYVAETAKARNKLGDMLFIKLDDKDATLGPVSPDKGGTITERNRPNNRQIKAYVQFDEGSHTVTYDLFVIREDGQSCLVYGEGHIPNPGCESVRLAPDPPPKVEFP